MSKSDCSPLNAKPNCTAEYKLGTASASPDVEFVNAPAGAGLGIDSLALVDNGSSELAVLRNQQWSVTALVNNSTGSVAERYAYDHFGKQTIYAANGTTVRTASSHKNPYGYTSRRHDDETELMYFRARYYDPKTGEFISRDPLEYVDGASLYRGYFVPSSLDPNGTLTFSFKKCKLILKYEIQVFFYTGSGGAWTDAGKKKWLAAGESAIEKSWSNKRSLQTDDWLVSPEEAGPDIRREMCYAQRCPCFESGVTIEVDITFDTSHWSADEDHEVSVYKIPPGDFRGSFVGGFWGSELDSEDVYPRPASDWSAPRQIPIAHEFGHMIGLNHPSHGLPGVPMNGPREYDTQAGGSTKIGTPGDNIMGSGMAILPEHVGAWKTEMERRFPECDYEIK